MYKSTHIHIDIQREVLSFSPFSFLFFVGLSLSPSPSFPPSLSLSLARLFSLLGSRFLLPSIDFSLV